MTPIEKWLEAIERDCMDAEGVCVNSPDSAEMRFLLRLARLAVKAKTRLSHDTGYYDSCIDRCRACKWLRDFEAAGEEKP